MSKKQTVLIIVILILAFSAGWGIYEWVPVSPNQQNASVSSSPEVSDNVGPTGAGRGGGFCQMVRILDLSPGQTREFSRLENQYRQQVHEYLQKIDSIDQAVIEEIKRDAPDREKLDNLAASSGAIQRALKKATTDHFLEIKEICTPVQRDKFNEILSGIGRLRQGRGKGRGWGWGRGQCSKQGGGQRFNSQ